MNYMCISRPCDDRDGTKYKTYWELTSVDSQCCQDCRGKVFPPGKTVSENTMTATDSQTCEVKEISECKVSLDSSDSSSIGMIEVSYESSNCCYDSSGWTIHNSPAVIEPTTCSTRTCLLGKPAQWNRFQVFERKCGCCLRNDEMFEPGTRFNIGETWYQCCDGNWVEEIETEVTSSTTTTTTTTTSTEKITTTEQVEAGPAVSLIGG